jgi:hypothetical protein
MMLTQCVLIEINFFQVTLFYYSARSFVVRIQTESTAYTVNKILPVNVSFSLDNVSDKVIQLTAATMNIN